MPQGPAQLLSQADKAYSSAGSGFSFFGSRTEKFEDAVGLYKDAAAAYRVGEDFRQAGALYEKVPLPFYPPLFSPSIHVLLGSDTYNQIAMIQGDKLNEPDDKANTLVDAFTTYNQYCPEDAARCLSQAIDHYLSKGNFRRAAYYKEKLGDHYKTKLKDQSKARSAYADAAQWNEGENMSATANKLNLLAADLAALDGDYLDAIKRYEHVAEVKLSDGRVAQSAAGTLMCAGICHLALDFIGAKRALESYRVLDPSFPSTRECQLLADLLAIVELGDSQAFEDRMLKYDQLGPLNVWQKTLLNKVKDQITEKEDDFS